MGRLGAVKFSCAESQLTCDSCAGDFCQVVEIAGTFAQWNKSQLEQARFNSPDVESFMNKYSYSKSKPFEAKSSCSVVPVVLFYILYIFINNLLRTTGF
jgi:hypothetical protein